MGNTPSSAVPPQPDTWAATPVRADELDAGLLFQGLPQRCQDSPAGLRGAAFELAKGHNSHLGRSRQIILGPIDERAGRATLCWCHVGFAA